MNFLGKSERFMGLQTAKFLMLKLFSCDVRLARAILLTFSLAITAFAYLAFKSSLSFLEERLGNFGWTVSPNQEIEERITIVAVDEKSIAAVGPWPWPRETLAKLVKAIDDTGAKLQIHDIVYSEPRDGDDELVEALNSARGAVISQIPILPGNSSDVSTFQDLQVGVMTHALSGIACSSSQGDTLKFPDSTSYIGSDERFAGISKGHIAPIVNSDGSITKQPAVVCVDGHAYPALAIAALHKASGVGPERDKFSARVERINGFWGSGQRLVLEDYPGLSIPIDENGNFRISYAKHPSAYRAVSAADLLDGSADLSLLSGAWVLVGATAFGLDDVVPTPFSGSAPGVELQARVLGSILDANVPFAPRSANWVMALVCLGFLALLLASDSSNRFGRISIPAFVFLLPLSAFGLHIQALHSFSVWLGWIFPAMFGSISSGVLLLFDLGRVRNQKNRIRANFESYLPSDVAKQIAYSMPNSDISASRRNVTLLSADLRNFSAYTESRPAEESAAVLHFFFQRVAQVVERFGGRIHEFKGDGALAIWDSQDAKSAEMALQAGTQMLEEINHQLLARFAPKGHEPLVLGVGIEQGPALIGSIGPAHRRTHALLGDTVTIVLRIQEMTSDLAQSLLLGECVARQIQDVQLQSQGSYLLAGLINPHTLFAPVSLAPISKENHGGSNLKLLFGGKR